jgi:putative PIN family toxin of toxin-antitoxin system
MAIPPYRVFFDTSVYIAALISPKGASGELIRLAEAKAIYMVVSKQVVVESDRVLKNKFPDLIENSRTLWKDIQPEIVPDPTTKQLDPFSQKLHHGDASILCSAHQAKASSFVTWNTRDFMGPGVKSLVSFPIVIPSDCLKLFRMWIEPFLE